MEVITLIGDTGTGKTRWAMDTYPDAFVAPAKKGSGMYFDGYEDHEVVIFDELYGNMFSHKELLRVTDRYPLKLAIHGGYVNFRPFTIVITSNAHPGDWYNNEKFPYHGGPLERRLTTGLSRIYRVDMGGVLVLLEGNEPEFIGPLNLL